MKKVIVNKEADSIDIHKCSADKIYVFLPDRVCSGGLLQVHCKENNTYCFRPLDNSLVRNNNYGAGDFHTVIKIQMDMGRAVYQFDTLKEAMLFVFQQ